MEIIESTNYPANSVTGNQLDGLKERIEAQPHIETMTAYTIDLVDNHLKNTEQYYQSIDNILS